MTRCPVLLGAGLALLLVACTSSAPPTGHASPAVSKPRAQPPTPTPLPPCALASTNPAGPPGVTSSGSLWTIASGLNQPDDVLFADGKLLVALLGAGTIQVMTPGAPTTTLPVHIPSVEGMVYIGSGLYAGGQAQDLVDEIDGNQLRTVIQLVPVAGQDGVDGIGAQNGSLIVPDSPHGVIDWVDPASGHVTRQLGGFVRPTGVWPNPDGSLLVADEFGNAAYTIAPDGSRSTLVRNLPIVDDIAQDSQGAVFVVTPAASGGRLAQLVNGSAQDLASRLGAPQGLAVDGADNLYFTEEDAGRVDLLIRTFKLVPLQAVADSSTQPVCVDVSRASGFADEVTLEGSAGLQVVQQPGAGSRGALLVTGCQTSPCPLTAISGSRRDTLWIQAHA
jgi:hypothetical protein